MCIRDRYSEVGDVIEPKGLGSNTNNKIIKTLFSNISTTYNVESIELIDKSNFTYKLTLFDSHNFIIGDNALINDIFCIWPEDRFLFEILSSSPISLF